MKPRAVPGRWRAMTQPAAETRRPSGAWRSPVAERMPEAAELGAAEGHGVGADGEAGAGVVADEAVFGGGHLAKRRG